MAARCTDCSCLPGCSCLAHDIGIRELNASIFGVHSSRSSGFQGFTGQNRMPARAADRRLRPVGRVPLVVVLGVFHKLPLLLKAVWILFDLALGAPQCVFVGRSPLADKLREEVRVFALPSGSRAVVH